MTPTEAAEVVAYAAGFDSRIFPDQNRATVWADAIEPHITVPWAVAAIRAYYQANTDPKPVRPDHVNEFACADRVEADRLRASIALAANPNLLAETAAALGLPENNLRVLRSAASKARIPLEV